MNMMDKIKAEACAFDAAFKKRFKNSEGRITRTPFHVMSFMAGCWESETDEGADVKRSEMLQRYERYCKRRGINRTWMNALEFVIQGRIA